MPLSEALIGCFTSEITQLRQKKQRENAVVLKRTFDRAFISRPLARGFVALRLADLPFTIAPLNHGCSPARCSLSGSADFKQFRLLKSIKRLKSKSEYPAQMVTNKSNVR